MSELRLRNYSRKWSSGVDSRRFPSELLKTQGYENTGLNDVLMYVYWGNTSQRAWRLSVVRKKHHVLVPSFSTVSLTGRSLVTTSSSWEQLEVPATSRSRLPTFQKRRPRWETFSPPTRKPEVVMLGHLGSANSRIKSSTWLLK